MLPESDEFIRIKIRSTDKSRAMMVRLCELFNVDNEAAVVRMALYLANKVCDYAEGDCVHVVSGDVIVSLVLR